MLSTVLTTIRRERLFEAGQRVLCAVSGGPDSIALLSVLWELAARLGITLEVATVDHGLRPAARAEATLVADRARALGLPFHLLTVDVGAARRGRRGASLQDAARDARLAALADLAGQRDAARVALGHQADDQAETVLFRVLRGTGLHGLGGIPYRRDPFVRPLLDVWRSEILTYLGRRSISFAQDPSNLDSRFARARLRHQVLPLLRRENPRVAHALVALAADARRAEDAGGLPPPSVEHGDGNGAPALGRSARATIERLRARGGTSFVDVAGGRVEVAYGRTRWTTDPGGPATDAVNPPPPVSIGRPGRYSLNGELTILVEEVTAAPGAQAAGDSDVAAFDAAFDADRLPHPLLLRARRPGDRMRPRGGRGSRKLSDLLIDHKVARSLRASLPVLTAADDTILFVPGLRPSELGRPTESTRRWLLVKSLSPAESSV